MRLRNPGKIDDAIAEVRNQKSLCGNSLNPTEPEARLKSFIDWCNYQGEPMLRNHFTSSPLLDQIDISRQRAISCIGAETYIIHGTLNRERSEWERRFDAAMQKLNDLKTLTEIPGYPLVLDTSALMEGEFFTEFVWQTIDGSLQGERVRLIVPILVVEELDALKTHRDGRKRVRAAKTLRELATLHGGKPTRAAVLPKHPNVTIEVFLDDGWHQRMPNNDGEIIEQAADLQGLLGERIMFVARDIAQVYRASAAGLSAVFIPPQINED